uniref:Catalytic n=1 Tax=Rhizophora mucronata TaxID=61149 RepID=A0A2P2NIS5_RHIMU
MIHRPLRQILGGHRLVVTAIAALIHHADVEPPVKIVHVDLERRPGFTDRPCTER